MGCANSKQKRCKNCDMAYSPVPRSYSMHVVHPPQEKGDSYHVVALTSTTLGSLSLDSSNHHVDHDDDDRDLTKGNSDCRNGENGIVIEDENVNTKDFSVGLIEAKTWSNMIEAKITRVVPKTPVMTPPGEPETINTWELMAGLEGTSPLHLSNNRFRSFSFDVSGDHGIVAAADSPRLMFEQQQPKPIWLQMVEEDTNPNAKSPEFDPEVLSTFRKSLQELSPDHPFYIKQSDQKDQSGLSIEVVDEASKVNAVVSKDFNKASKDRLLIYFTSLRGVRKTYEDCCHVRVILKGLGVRVDERDVSMHSGFKEELKELLGEGSIGGGLPRVFIGKKYIGGAEEIRRMHEEGHLEKLVEGCEMVDDSVRSGGGGVGACEACGDIRFVPCETCSGSCKIFYEADEQDEQEDQEDEQEDQELEQEESEEGIEYGFQRCPDCNENGLIRCPICCY